MLLLLYSYLNLSLLSRVKPLTLLPPKSSISRSNTHIEIELENRSATHLRHGALPAALLEPSILSTDLLHPILPPRLFLHQRDRDQGGTALLCRRRRLDRPAVLAPYHARATVSVGAEVGLDGGILVPETAPVEPVALGVLLEDGSHESAQRSAA
jgi:hypothetical protein